eukprot:247438-Amphidinium_carterae.1
MSLRGRTSLWRRWPSRRHASREYTDLDRKEMNSRCRGTSSWMGAPSGLKTDSPEGQGTR